MSYSNGKCSLTWSKKREQYENSTKSCTVGHYVAYSYREKIALVNDKKNYVLFNYHKFSVTTSVHQNRIMGHGMYANNESYYLDCTSINNFDFKNLDTLNAYRITEDLRKFCNKYFKKQAKKYLAKIEADQLERETWEREQKNKRARERNLIKKIELLKYPSFKKLLEACKKLNRQLKCQLNEKNIQNKPIEFLRELRANIRNYGNENYIAENLGMRFRPWQVEAINKKLNLSVFENLGN